VGSMPTDDQIDNFDFTIFDRELTGPDYAQRTGPVYQLIWGRHMSPATVDKFAEKVVADVILTGHQPQEMGHAANGAPYNMAKAALEALALTLAKEEKKHGIFVNIVAPGLVDTDMGQRLAKAAMGAADIHQLDAAMPFGHVCQPEEVAAVVRFLVSPANSYVTGEKVNVHGGGR